MLEYGVVLLEICGASNLCVHEQVA